MHCTTLPWNRLPQHWMARTMAPALLDGARVLDPLAFSGGGNMYRKTLFVAGLAVVGVALWAGVVCPGQTAGQVDKSRGRKVAPYVHAVIFHVKKDAPEGEV